MDIASARSSDDPDALPQALRNFFRAAARIGEARMLARIAERLDEICTGRWGAA